LFFDPDFRLQDSILGCEQPLAALFSLTQPISYTAPQFSISGTQQAIVAIISSEIARCKNKGL